MSGVTLICPPLSNSRQFFIPDLMKQIKEKWFDTLKNVTKFVLKKTYQFSHVQRRWLASYLTQG
jgi:hypothetical protein